MGINGGRSRNEEAARAAEVAAELSDVVYAMRLEPDMAFEYVSPSVEALVGYTPAEHYSDPLLGTKVLDPRDADILTRAAQARIGESVEFTVRWRARDGGTVWTAHRCHKQRRDDGSVVLYGAARDVSAEHDLADRLAEAQEQYRLLAENSSDFVFRLDTSGVIEWVSPNVTALLGWLPSEWVGHNRAEFTHPGDIPEDIASAGVIDGSERRGGRVRVRTSSGTYRWVDMSVTDVIDDGGQIIGEVGSARDAQDRVLAEAALAERERVLQRMLENATDVVFDVAPDNTYRWVSPSVTEALGWDPQQLVGKSGVDLIHPDDYAAVVAARGKTHSGLASTHEFRYRQADGTYRWMSGTSREVRDQDGILYGRVVGLRDVSKLVQARDALADSERRYQLLAENAADFVVQLSADLIIEWVSPSVTAVTGWSPQDMVGRLPWDFFPPEPVRVSEQVAERVLAGDQVSGRRQVRCADGSDRWVSRTVQPITDDSGAVVSIISGCRDVQAEVEAEERLAASEQRYRLLAENAADLVYSADADWVVTWVSPSVSTALGWSPQDLVGTVMADLLHPDDRSATEGLRVKALDGEMITTPPGGLVLRFRTKSGVYRWMAWNQATDVGAGPTPPGLVASLHDVNDLVGARRQVDAQRARLRATMDSLLDPHMLMEAVRDASGTIVDFVCTDANPAACAFAGRQYQDFIGARMLDVVPGPVGADLLRVCRRVVETGEPTGLDDLPYSHEPLGGVQRHFDIRANRVGDGLSYTWRDVTARHEAEQRLAASQEQYRLLAENASDIVFRGNNEAVLQWISPSVTSVLGWEPQDMVGHRISEFLHPDDAPGIHATSENLKHGAANPGYQARVRTRSGGYLWMAVNARPLVDAAGVVIGRVGSARNVQAEVSARQSLAASEAQYRLLAQNATDTVFLLNSIGAVDWVSPAVRRVLGYQPEELVGTMTVDLVHPEDLSVLSSMATKVAHGQEGVPWQVRMRTREGEYRWMSAMSGPMLDTEGAVTGRITTVRDVHELVLGQEALARSEETFRLAMEGAPEGMAVLGLHQAFRQVNPALCAMLGRDEEWMLSHGIRDVLDPESLEADLAARDRLLAGEAKFEIHEVRMITATGAPLWVQHSIALVRDEHRMPLFYVSQYQDVTDARAAKADLEYRSQHDTLTGLINREQLQRRIADVLTRVPRRAGVPALLFCDLDHFKWINDQHGHAAGDHVLRVTADRITSTLRDTDEVARLGGDEFVAVLPEAFDLDAAERVAQKVRTAVAQPIPIGGEQIVITVSIGVALATPGIEARRLLHNADDALYEAKNSGRDRVETFDGD